jgi:hypothetical protein
LPAAKAGTAPVVLAGPPMLHSGLQISSMGTQVTGRMFSPSIGTMAPVMLSTISFWSGAKTCFINFS